MPRQSRAARSIPPPIGRSTPLLAAPTDLSPTERAEWRRAVDAMPAGFFGQEATPMIARYVRHLRRAAELDALLGHTDPGGDLMRYTRIAAAAREESRLALTLGRALRLTPASRTPAVTAARAVAGMPPNSGMTDDERIAMHFSRGNRHANT